MFWFHYNQSWSCKCLNGQIIFTVTWTFFIESESKQNWTEEKWLDTPARQYQYPCTLLIPWSLSNNQIFQKIVSLLSAKMHFGQASCSLKLTALKLPTYLVSGKMIGQKCLDHLDCINQVKLEQRCKDTDVDSSQVHFPWHPDYLDMRHILAVVDPRYLTPLHKWIITTKSYDYINHDWYIDTCALLHWKYRVFVTILLHFNSMTQLKHQSMSTQQNQMKN